MFVAVLVISFLTLQFLKNMYIHFVLVLEVQNTEQLFELNYFNNVVSTRHSSCILTNFKYFEDFFFLLVINDGTVAFLSYAYSSRL